MQATDVHDIQLSGQLLIITLKSRKPNEIWSKSLFEITLRIKFRDNNWWGKL
jgi:hypothetical protein